MSPGAYPHGTMAPCHSPNPLRCSDSGPLRSSPPAHPSPPPHPTPPAPWHPRPGLQPPHPPDPTHPAPREPPASLSCNHGATHGNASAATPKALRRRESGKCWGPPPLGPFFTRLGFLDGVGFSAPLRAGQHEQIHPPREKKKFRLENSGPLEATPIFRSDSEIKIAIRKNFSEKNSPTRQAG
jgi:hypothetical protein